MHAHTDDDDDELMIMSYLSYSYTTV